MLRAYGPDCDGSQVEGDGQIPPGATWIDLNEPTTGAVPHDGFVYNAHIQNWKWDDKTEAVRDGLKLAPIMLRRVQM